MNLEQIKKESLVEKSFIDDSFCLSAKQEFDLDTYTKLLITEILNLADEELRYIDYSNLKYRIEHAFNIKI